MGAVEGCVGRDRGEVKQIVASLLRGLLERQDQFSGTT